MTANNTSVEPRLIRMDRRDNVAIVANDGGLVPGVRIDGGITLLEHVPQGHKVALQPIAAGEGMTAVLDDSC